MKLKELKFDLLILEEKICKEIERLFPNLKICKKKLISVKEKEKYILELYFLGEDLFYINKESIEKIKDLIFYKFNLSDVKIEILKINNIFSNANALAEKIKRDYLKNPSKYRQTISFYLEKLKEEKDIKGAQITFSGKFAGQRHRTDKFLVGNLKVCGGLNEANMDYGKTTAYISLGTVGISVNIMNSYISNPDKDYLIN